MKLPRQVSLEEVSIRVAEDAIIFGSCIGIDWASSTTRSTRLYFLVCEMNSTLKT